MKASVFFIAYFLTAAVIAALIAFPLFQLFGNDTFKFESWVTRSALLCLVLGIIPCRRAFSLSFTDFGYSGTFKINLKRIAKGFCAGLLILSVVIFILLLLDNRVLSNDAELTLKLILTALLAGCVVALIEETLFRGLFYKLTERWHNAHVAIIISSLFYALLHFIKPIEHIDQNTLSLLTGFEVIINAFTALGSMQPDDFFALFSVGVLLSLVRFKTQSLAYCIGLHASWVFLIKITKKMSDSNTSSEWAFLTGSYDGIIGLLCFAWLTILCVIYLSYILKQTNPSNP
jgi:hypothetical protein